MGEEQNSFSKEEFGDEKEFWEKEEARKEAD